MNIVEFDSSEGQPVFLDEPTHIAPLLYWARRLHESELSRCGWGDYDRPVRSREAIFYTLINSSKRFVFAYKLKFSLITHPAFPRVNGKVAGGFPPCPSSYKPPLYLIGVTLDLPERLAIN